MNKESSRISRQRPLLLTKQRFVTLFGIQKWKGFQISLLQGTDLLVHREKSEERRPKRSLKRISGGLAPQSPRMENHFYDFSTASIAHLWQNFVVFLFANFLKRSPTAL